MYILFCIVQHIFCKWNFGESNKYTKRACTDDYKGQTIDMQQPLATNGILFRNWSLMHYILFIIQSILLFQFIK